MDLIFFAVLCVFIIGIGPMLLTIPINGLTIWGQILGILNIYNKALLTWFLLSNIFLIISMLIKLLRRKVINIRHIEIIVNLLKPWVLFCIYLFINYFFYSHFGINQAYSLKKITLFVLKGIVPAFFISIWLLLSKKNTIERVERAIVGYSIIQVYFLLKYYLSGNDFRRLTIFGLNPIWLARELGLGTLASFSIFKGKIGKILVMSILIFGIFLTRSRGPLLALAMTLLVLYSIKLFSSKKYKQLAPIIVIITIFLAIIILDVGMVEYFTRGESSFLMEKNVRSRINLYIAAWNDFIESPIMGKGIGNYCHQGHNYPHNIFLELLAETGLIGFILFIIALKPKNMLYFNNTFSLYMLFALLTTMFSGDLEKNSYLVLFSIILHLEVMKDRNAVKSV